MHSMLLALLASEKPELASEYLKTLSIILDEKNHGLTPALHEAASDIYSQLSVLLKQANHPVPPAAKPRTRPSWLKGVVDGGVS